MNSIDLIIPVRPLRVHEDTIEAAGSGSWSMELPCMIYDYVAPAPRFEILVRDIHFWSSIPGKIRVD